MEVRHYPADTMYEYGRALLEAMGATSDEASQVSEALLHGSLHGHPGQGQGYNKLPREWARIQAGGIRPGAILEEIQRGPNWVLLEGNKGFGAYVAARAMDRAIAFAQETGIGMAFVRGSNHLTASGFHALRAAEAGMVGLCMTNAGPEMAPWGGITPILGTNPWGIAVPTGGDFPLILDIALTQSGKGMVRWYQKEGRTVIPTNWAYAPDGTETDDPSLAMEGPLVPMGEHKGVGLSFMTDVLCGVLTGAAFGVDTYSDPQHHNVGHMMLAIDPDRFLGREFFLQRLEVFCDQVKGTELKAGVDQVYLPGELDHMNRVRRLEEGIPVEDEMREALSNLAAELGVEDPLV